MTLLAIRCARTPGTSLSGLGAILGVLFLAGSALAQVQVAPGGGIVLVSSSSRAAGVEDPQSQEGPGLGVWARTLLSHAHDTQTGADASAYMTIGTSIDSTGVYISLTGSAEVHGSDATTSGAALIAVMFVVSRCQEYSGSTYFDPTSLGPMHVAAFVANVALEGIALTNMISQVGTTPFHGRLAPGFYVYFYQNAYGPDTQSGYATTLVNSIGFETVPNPLVTQHPQDQTVPAGSTASFSVGATAPGIRASAAAGTTGYQWRRNYQNLADGGRVSGSASSQLQIASVVRADSGYYDCVVTRDAIDEPSSIARLAVTDGTSDVGESPGVARVALLAPSPNPFGAGTRIRYSLPRSAEVRLDVIDIAGRVARELVGGEGRSAGEHSVEWDGRSSRGEQVAAGVYFVRLRAGGANVVRRVVRIGTPN